MPAVLTESIPTTGTIGRHERSQSCTANRHPPQCQRASVMVNTLCGSAQTGGDIFVCCDLCLICEPHRQEAWGPSANGTQVALRGSEQIVSRGHSQQPSAFVAALPRKATPLDDTRERKSIMVRLRHLSLRWTVDSSLRSGAAEAFSHQHAACLRSAELGVTMTRLSQLKRWPRHR